jgi:quinone-modifying oxidoreductase subunit QmoC
MPDAYLVKPDREFTQQVMALGGGSLKQCFQCATCSVTCSLSPAERPFPRKEMVWAQWGLKDKLMGDPDVWLCHRCGDCSAHCPRGAAPGDVLAAVRDYTIQQYSFPRFMGKALARPGFLPLLLGIPALLMIALLAGIGHLDMPTGDVVYEHFFPHLPLQAFFGLFAGLAFVASLVGASRFWRDLNRGSPAGGSTGLVASFWGTVGDILTHAKFRDCTENKNRNFSHLLTFYGFIGLFVTTSGVVVSAYIFDYYPIPLFHPLKIFGNLSTLAILAGVAWIIRDRASKPVKTETSTRYDWTFIILLFAVILTGIATEVLRFADVPSTAYPVYFIHLVVVFGLLIYLPYSRFAHAIYRTVALVHARHTGRESAGKQG